MTSAWCSEFSSQSESSEDSDSNFVDFLPECSGPGGIFSEPKFENFQMLIERANDWLCLNQRWEIKTCESIEFKAQRRKVDSEVMIYMESGEAPTSYIRGLRLWLTGRKSGDKKVQKIGYLNLVPESVKKGGMFSAPKFESLDDVVARFNTMIRTRPLPGRIITIESQEMKMKNSKDVEPDKSFWIEMGSMSKHFLFIIRIFYEVTDEVSDEEIGFVNFTPDFIKKAGIFSQPIYKSFPNAVKKASDWCVQQYNLKICNLQSLEIKVGKGNEADPQSMYYIESGSMITCYLRIIRVAFTKPRIPVEETLTEITCKIFYPVLLKSSLCTRKFESLTETKTRIIAWLKVTGAQVISAETTAVCLQSFSSATEGAEASFRYNPSDRIQHWIFVIRLYFNGFYEEPPPEMLPPVPELIEQNCCTTS